MYHFWHWLLYLLAWAAHDPATLNAERSRCAGAVAVAYAALSVEPPPPAPRRDKVATDTSKVGSDTDKVGSELGKKNAPEFPTTPDCPASDNTPNADKKCAACGNTGRIYRSDGGYVRCPCGACPTGRCPTAR